MNILLVCHSSQISGGAEDDFSRLVSYLNKNSDYTLYGLFPKGERAKTFASYFAKWSYIKEGYFPIIFSTIRDYFRFLKYFIAQFTGVYKFIKKEKVDLCIINVSVLLIPCFALKLKKIQTLIFIRENIKPVAVKKIIYRLWNLLNCFFICHTKEIEDEYRKLTGKNNIKLIRLAIEKDSNDDFNITEISPDLKEFLDDNGQIFISVGPICDLKNQKLILEAFELIKIENKAVVPKILFVGKQNEDSLYYKEMESFIKDNDLTKNVFITGEKSKSFVYYLYSKVSALIISSKSEGFGLTMVEAMKYSLPVISTQVGVIPEIIEDDLNGMIIENTPLSLKNKILKIIENSELKKSISKAGNKTFLNEFNLEVNLMATKNLIDSLVEK